MLNGFFVLLVVASILTASFAGGMQALTQGLLDSAGKAVTLALGLVGTLAFFLGLLRVGADAGLIALVARAAGPVMRRLFPGVPRDHPAHAAIVLNVASTFLGLGNAATPFGIRAMQELDRLNPSRGTATDAMVVFLAINTAGMALVPTSVLAMRASLGSSDPAGILVPTWIAGLGATATGILAALLLRKLPAYRAPAGEPAPVDAATAPDEAPIDAATPALEPRRGGALVAAACAFAFLMAAILHITGNDTRTSGDIVRDLSSYWILPALIGGIVLFGWARGVNVYASFVDGAREGFDVAVRIVPYLVAILAAVGMFRASGALEALVAAIGPATRAIGLPVEALPVAIMRPLSGSGSYALMGEVMQAHGPDSLLGRMVSAIQGSTETTFYVLAVYFGAVGVKRTRHALPACLLADVVGITTAIVMVKAW